MEVLLNSPTPNQPTGHTVFNRIAQAAGTRRFLLGFLMGVLLIFLLLGALWGLIQPQTQIVVDEEGMVTLAIDTEGSAGISFLGGSAILLILGLAIGLVQWRLFLLRRGIGMMIWATGLSLVGSLLFIYVSNTVLISRNANLSAPDIVEDTAYNLNQPIAYGTALLIAPFLTALSYWLCALLSHEEDFTPESTVS